MKTSPLFCLAPCIFLFCASGALAQNATDTQPPPEPSIEEYALEAYPQNLATKLREHYIKTREIVGDMRGVYSSVDIWPHNIESLVVCFIDGPTKLRRQVVSAARRWTTIGAHVPLDFGPAGKLRECKKGQKAHIRIAFERGGIWSLIGQQSMNGWIVNPDQASMNLGFSPRTHPLRIRRIVLHEFGHALGLEHEHQHPFIKCWDAEYNKKKLVAYLRAQRGWNRRQAQAQLSVIRRSGTMATDPDKNSIMLYAFPKDFYLKRDKSPCYAKESLQISKADKALIRGIYPRQYKTRAEQQRERRKLLLARLRLRKEKNRNRTRSSDDGVTDEELNNQLDALVPPVH